MLIGTKVNANCSKPFGLSFLERTTTTVEIRWSDGNINPTGWEIEIVERSKAPKGIPNFANLINRNFTISMLKPSTAYDLYIRTRCSDISISDWNGPFLFTTVFTNPTECQINVPVKDNGIETFFIQINHPGKLGTDVFVNSVELLMAHTWPADMQISLESPSGKTVILTNHYGTITDNFGNIDNSGCGENAIFDSDACEAVKDGKPPFNGRFRPEESFSLFDDNTPASGIWKLKTQDRAVQDIGILKYLKIEFSTERCVTPAQFTINDINVNDIEVSWSSFPFCNAARISIGSPDVHPDSLTQYFINCQNNKFTISGLSPNTEYQIFISAVCGTGISTGSCPILFRTACEAATLVESFDTLNTCREGCGFSCSISGNWYNAEYDGVQDWIIWSGKTDTDNTGPDSDISGIGKYIYIENNPEICDSTNTIILESKCMNILSNISGCDMSFYYHMYGKDIEKLYLEVNTKDNGDWETIFYKAGNQGSDWIQHTLSLSDYDGHAGRFRFRAISGNGISADIALDQIEFYKSTIKDGLIRYYLDADGDGFGKATDYRDLCTLTAPEGYVTVGGDCDDNNPAINPGAIEIPCNTIDENCNGNEDNNPESNPIFVEATIIPESCNGYKDGLINLNLSGGTPPYTIRWNNNKTGTFLDQLSHGIYYAEITDFGGCFLRTSFYEVPVNNQINFSVINLERPSCEGKSDGSITIGHSGGIEPISYMWSNGSHEKNLSQISSGNYIVSMTDAEGCRFVSTAILVESRPSIIAGIASMKSPGCFGGNNGSITIQAQNGTPPYNFQWNNGQNGNTLNMIPSGNYICSVYDANGCKAVVNANLSQPTALRNDIVSIEQVRCFGENSGAIKTFTTGGSPPYTYFWNNFLFTESIFDIPAGDYDLLINDRNGCELNIKGIKVSQPDKLISVVENVTPSVCPLGKNGTISVKVTGGIPEYFYAWKSGASHSNLVDNLSTGLYSVTVFDRNGCKNNISNILVPFLNQPILSELKTVKQNKCYLDKIAIVEVNVLNGTKPFDYNWSTGIQYIKEQSKDSVFNLGAGLYKVTVTDSLGCFGESSALIIPEKTVFDYTLDSITNNLCSGDSTGRLTLTVNGGSPPFSILWNNQLSGNEIKDLANGIYFGTITDSENCSISISPINIESESHIMIDATISHSVEGTENGSICLSLSGAFFPVTIKWDISGMSDSYCVTNLAAGLYSVTITDALGCMSSRIFEVEAISSTINPDASKSAPTIYPNPASTGLFLKNLDKIELIEIYDSNLRAINFAKYQDYIDIQLFSAGVYYIKLYDKDRVYLLRFIKI